MRTKMIICSLNDYNIKEMRGGSTLTAKEFNDFGKKRGHSVIDCSPENFKECKSSDLFILHNFAKFHPYDIEWIGQNKPYIFVNHDYIYCKKRNGCASCNPECVPNPLLKQMYKNAKLVVFFSPLQKSKYEKAFGFKFKNDLVIPPPMNTDLFFKDESVQKDEYLFLGMIGVHKGVVEVLDWAKKFNKRIFFAGKVIDNKLLNRVLKEGHFYIGEVDYKTVPLLMRQFKFFFWCSLVEETFGRTLMESVLSGCQIVSPHNYKKGVGLKSYNTSAPEGMVKLIKESNVKFWDKLEEKCAGIIGKELIEGENDKKINEKEVKEKSE